MRYLLTLLLALHGSIHLMGWSSAFHLSNIRATAAPLSKAAGLCWLLAALLLFAAALLHGLRLPAWWITALTGVLFSQALIFSQWHTARYGTLANGILLLLILPLLTEALYVRQYRRDAAAQMAQLPLTAPGRITEADLKGLPEPVQAYLRYSGCAGKEKVHLMRVRFKGQMREQGKDFFAFTSEQVNNFSDPARLFYMRARVQGLPTTGYHRYQNGHASMDIRLLSVLPVVHTSGGELDQAETVTLFNDMCILAPATLLDKRIQWEPIDNLHARARFTNNNITISALLVFNAQGALVNFISDDRYALKGNNLERHRFSTPLSRYRWFNGYRLASHGEAVWHYPDGPFVYGRFELQEVRYNAAAQQDR